MAFTKLKKKKSISNRVTAVSTAFTLSLSSLGVMNVPSIGAKNDSPKRSYALTASLISMSLNLKALNNDVLIDSVVTTTSPLTTTSTTIATTTSTTTTSMATTSTSTTTTTTVTEPETTTTETEETTTEETTTEVATTEEESVETEPPREYVVFKPSTHYIHRSTCRWMNSECYEIENTEGLECRRCSECNPDMEIVTEFVVQQPQQATVAAAATNNDGGYYSLNFITDVERIYLCNVVGTEYGSDWVPLYDKACVVATIMNRVHDGGWTNGRENTIYNVLTAPYQYNPDYAVPYYRSNVTQSCIDAVEYYFQHQEEFPHYTSFCGDGRYNYFR